MSFESWLSRAQVVSALQVSAEYVQALAKSGRLAFVQTQLGRLYDPASVEAARTSGVGQIRNRAARVS